MADGFIQLPGDSTGKKIDTSDLVVGASTSVHRERYVAADPTSATGLATVTSSGGLQVAVTNPSTAVTVTNLVRSLSSGTVTLSSNPTVVLSSATSLSSGTVTLSSNHTFVSASSGLVQISGGTFLTSGTVTLSSNPTVISASSGLVQISGTPTVVSASSGLVQISGTPTVTATAATNPWSSAPSFNIPLVSASSGLVQISGTATIVSASSGLVQISGTPTVTATAATNPWSSAPSFNVPVINASSGVVQVLTSGALLLSSVGITQAIVTGSSGVGALVSSGNSLQVTTTQTPVVVTTSGALLVSGTPGSVSTQVNVIGSTGAVAVVTSAGSLQVFTTASASGSTSVDVANQPTVLTASSGYLVRSLSSGTVTLSSAPSVSQAVSLISAVSSGAWFTDQRIQLYSSVPQFAEVSATSSGHVTIVSAVTSMSIYVLGYALIADSSNTMIWESSNTDLSGTMLFSTAGSGIVCPLVSPAAGAWLKTSVGGDLGILQGNAGTIQGHLTYYTATS